MRHLHITRRIVVSWILGASLMLLSAASVLADGGGVKLPH